MDSQAGVSNFPGKIENLLRVTRPGRISSRSYGNLQKKKRDSFGTFLTMS
jgi:hypothetical protein